MALIPNQLVLPGFRSEAQVLTSVTSDEVTLTSDEVIPINGQGKLFSSPRATPIDDGRRSPVSSETGKAGEDLVAGACLAKGLNISTPRNPAQAGFDLWVELRRIQVKATHEQRKDGRLQFGAGSAGRFANYRDKCDYFAFVVTAIDHYLWNRMVIMEADVVINQWPGPTVYLHPSDFPNLPDLALLLPQVTDKALEELLAP